MSNTFMSSKSLMFTSKTGFVLLLGEIPTRAFVNFDDLVRSVVKDIGYDSSDKGFDGNTCGVQAAIASQSPDIAQGVDHALEVRDAAHTFSDNGSNVSEQEVA